MLLAPAWVAHCSCHDGGSDERRGQEAHQVQPAQLLEGGDQQHGQSDCQGQASGHVEGAEAPQACRAADTMLLAVRQSCSVMWRVLRPHKPAGQPRPPCYQEV